ncbi:MAG TPA: hypothetical protein VFV50_11535 [Bdellovibrionales bacterium]|nr:hypothetical protein [Bdellovibrionales bacterium]
METVQLMLVAFALFTAGCWYLARVVTAKTTVALTPEYSRTALRFARHYKIFAAGICVALWFWAVVSSFWAILSGPPF